jgi:transcriptional regulator with XRE-family HTH domain
MTESAWIGGRLRELREEKGLTQIQLAELVGVKRDAIARWEADVREPGWSNAVALADALGISTDEFRKKPAAAPHRGPGRPPRATTERAEAPKRTRGRPRKQR